MPEHHRLFPPSSSERWLSCTASPLPIAEAPQEDDSNIYSAEGTFAHEVYAAMVLNTQRGRMPASWHHPFKIGMTYQVNGFDFTLERGMIEYLQACVERVLDLGPGVTMVEQRVGFPAGFLGGKARQQIEGTADVIHQPDAKLDVLHIIDLKYGKGYRIQAEGNPQLQLYGLGVLSTFVPDLFDGIKTVVLHIQQPRLDHWDAWSLSVGELQAWGGSVVEDAVNEVLDGRGEFRPSPTACRWCPIGRAGECAAQTDAVLSMFSELDGEKTEKGIAHGQENLAHLLPVEDLGPLLLRAEWLVKVTDAMRERTRRLLFSGENVPDWKLVLGNRPARKWSVTDDEELADTLREESDGAIEPWVSKVVSPAGAEKQMGKAQFSTSKLAELVVQGDPAPTLVPETDKRPAWAPVNEEDFDEADVLS